MNHKTSLYIYGMAGSADKWGIDVPDDLILSGYMTNKGLLFCIVPKTNGAKIDENGIYTIQGGIFSKFMTKDEIKIYINQHKRKCKLQQLIQMEQKF